MDRILADVHARKGKQPVHQRLHVRLLSVDGLQISLAGCLILGHALQQALRVGADGSQRAFQIVGHAGDQLLLLLLGRLLLLQRGLQPRRHLIHRVTGGLELVRLRVGDGCVQVAVPDAGHARRQGVQRLGDVAEQVPRQIQIGQRHRSQQQHRRDGGKHAQRQLKAVEHRLDLLHRAVQRHQIPTQQHQRRTTPQQKQHRRRKDRYHQHGDIGARQPFFDGHAHPSPSYVAQLYHVWCRIVKQRLKLILFPPKMKIFCKTLRHRRGTIIPARR